MAEEDQKSILTKATQVGGSYLGHSFLQRPQCGFHSNHLPVGEKNQRLYSQVER